MKARSRLLAWAITAAILCISMMVQFEVYGVGNSYRLAAFWALWLATAICTAGAARSLFAYHASRAAEPQEVEHA